MRKGKCRNSNQKLALIIFLLFSICFLPGCGAYNKIRGALKQSFVFPYIGTSAVTGAYVNVNRDSPLGRLTSSNAIRVEDNTGWGANVVTNFAEKYPEYIPKNTVQKFADRLQTYPSLTIGTKGAELKQTLIGFEPAFSGSSGAVGNIGLSIQNNRAGFNVTGGYKFPNGVVAAVTQDIGTVGSKPETTVGFTKIFGDLPLLKNTKGSVMIGSNTRTGDLHAGLTLQPK